MLMAWNCKCYFSHQRVMSNARGRVKFAAARGSALAAVLLHDQKSVCVIFFFQKVQEIVSSFKKDKKTFQFACTWSVMKEGCIETNAISFRHDPPSDPLNNTCYNAKISGWTCQKSVRFHWILTIKRQFHPDAGPLKRPIWRNSWNGLFEEIVEK